MLWSCNTRQVINHPWLIHAYSRHAASVIKVSKFIRNMTIDQHLFQANTTENIRAPLALLRGINGWLVIPFTNWHQCGKQFYAMTASSLHAKCNGYVNLLSFFKMKITITRPRLAAGEYLPACFAICTRLKLVVFMLSTNPVINGFVVYGANHKCHV